MCVVTYGCCGFSLDVFVSLTLTGRVLVCVLSQADHWGVGGALTLSPVLAGAAPDNTHRQLAELYHLYMLP